MSLLKKWIIIIILSLIGLFSVALTIIYFQSGKVGDEEFPVEIRNLVFPIKVRRFYIGVTVNPSGKAKLSFEEDIRNSFKEVSEVGELVNYAGGWVGSSGNFLSEQLEAIYSLIEENDLKLVVEMSFFKFPESGNPIRDGLPLILPRGLTAENLSDPEFRRLYFSEALKIVEKFSPKYFVVGIEVNIYYLFERDDFENFLSLYFEIYDAIKSISPKTKVFVSFNLELMMYGFPGYDENSHWNLIKRFGDKLDLVAFTTYPFRRYKSPMDIPLGYYVQIKNFTDKPIAFTEIGWHSKYGEGDQLSFIMCFLNLTKSLKIEFIQWVYLHDLSPRSSASSLNSLMGLRSYDDEPKLSWYAWKKLYSLPFTP